MRPPVTVTHTTDGLSVDLSADVVALVVRRYQGTPTMQSVVLSYTDHITALSESCADAFDSWLSAPDLALIDEANAADDAIDRNKEK